MPHAQGGVLKLEVPFFGGGDHIMRMTFGGSL